MAMVKCLRSLALRLGLPLAFVSCFGGLAQTPSATPAAFEVASIKPADLSTMSPRRRVGPEIFIDRSSLKNLIEFSYDVETYQVEGGPPWVVSELYDIQGKAPAASTPGQFKAMVQSLLADRFHLRLAHELRTMSGYALVADKKGAKLPPARTDVPPDSFGVIQLGGGEIWSRGSTIGHLAHALWMELQVPVIDETHIDGHYDFKLRFEEGNRELAGPDVDGTAPGPGTGSVFTALGEIGLHLNSRKLPIEVLRIENAERPSGN